MSNEHLLNSRLPRLWHGGDYNPEQWPSQVWDDDVRLMQTARCNVATIGIFSWSKLEPSEGRFDFAWMDDVIDRLSRGDRWFILATPSAAPPAWLSRRYPETLRTGADGVRRRHGNRVNYNLASKVYREKTREIARRLSERYGAHPRLLAWHMSNEYGGADYGEESASAFRLWLQRKFGTLDALNAAYWTTFWSHTYTDWEEIHPPGAPHGEESIQGLTVDWQRFVTDQTIDFMLNEAAPLRELSPEVPITTNMMGTYPGLDYRKFASHIDFTSWDSYPAFQGGLEETKIWVAAAFKHDLTRSIKPKMPWLLMESTPSSGNWYPYMALKRPGMHRLEAVQAVAHGADGVQYFQWRQSRGSQEQLHGAVVGHAGDEGTRVFQEVKAVGEELESLAHLVGTQVDAEVAIVYDWEVRWAIDAASGPVRESKKYEETCIEHYRAFWQAGVPVDVIGLDDPLDRYKVVVAPMAYSLRPGFAERVKAFVEAGGTFVTTYLTGWVDENSLVYEGGFLSPLRELLGIWSEELDVLYPGHSKASEFVDDNDLGLAGQFTASDFCELIHLTTAKAAATYAEDFYEGRPSVTVNRVGDGLAYYVASRTEPTFNDAFLTAIAQKAGVETFLLPTGVTVQRRVGGGREFHFFLNATPNSVSFSTERSGKVELPPWGAEVR
ncbi:beta-galactosidase [Fimbriimonas ginsengisoli]|uniref:Beta-galactosidase n=1 Tax=Fimbriimonas ginsengisoli Gsoil 348 TaxID=661478 RepID=A0A068NTM2_FIMGI|nr:beta-galactosidase [Fimbriimonas ginsengisoli]AIE86080.1 glycoside hydrolase family protein [Fimbriimonas ginsengisoli Gsoil 348]